MKILIAPDKFKGSLSAQDICAELKAILSQDTDFEVEICPVADGGDGTIDILSSLLDFKKITVPTVDPLRREMTSYYFILGKEAYVGLAKASGLVLLEDEERNPMFTSTFGTGVLIKDAAVKGCDTMNLFVGGSATNDGGTGILEALGFQFLDKNQRALEAKGENLQLVADVKLPDNPIDFQLNVYTDVTNPPIGSQGAARVYAKQKGASEQDIEILERGMENVVKLIKRKTGLDVSKEAGLGAAGGVATALRAFIQAEVKNGMKYVSKMLDLPSKVKQADVIISGEGKIDASTKNGKVISHLSSLSKTHNKKFIVLAGASSITKEDQDTLGIAEIFTVSERAENLQDAMENAVKYVREIGEDIKSFLHK